MLAQARGPVRTGFEDEGALLVRKHEESMR